ncbi:Mur ligase family protein [Lamprobacter modestohalophilus]|nr:UDP-N-acetylmuramoyl-tripeptide--D-alanyl-D-alanine ligase [Lamprobacter modestohalophilus]
MDMERALIGSLKLLGRFEGSQLKLSEAVSLARSYIKERHGIDVTEISRMCEMLSSDLEFYVGLKNERVLDLEILLRRQWRLLSRLAGDTYTAETAEALALFRAITRTDAQNTMELLLSVDHYARTILNYLNMELLAEITEGEWVGAAGQVSFDRLVFSPTRLRGMNLLVAKRDSAAEAAYLAKPLVNHAILTDNPEAGFPEGTPLLVVRRVNRSIALLAHYARRHAAGMFVAVTGSAGKSSVKEMIAEGLSHQKLVSRTMGTSNSFLVASDVMINTPLQTDVSVYECGLGVNGSAIDVQSSIIRPHIAIITSIAPAHIGGYGSIEEIAKKKLQIAEGLDENGFLLIDGDCPIISRAIESDPYRELQHVIVRFGFSDHCNSRIVDWSVTEKGTYIEAIVLDERHTMTVPLYGRHWSKMALAVLTAIKLCGSDVAAAATRLAGFKTMNGRGQYLKLCADKGLLGVFDSHHTANPGSMYADLVAFDELYKCTTYRRKIAVIGAYRELGEHMERHHIELIDWLIAFGFEELFLVGEHEFDVAMPALQESQIAYHLFQTIEEGLKTVASAIKGDDLLFIKAPNNKDLKLVTPYLKETIAKANYESEQA